MFYTVLYFKDKLQSKEIILLKLNIFVGLVEDVDYGLDKSLYLGS